MLAGEFVEVRPWHNHPLHIVQHNQIRLSAKYQTMEIHVKALYDSHVNNHEMVQSGIDNQELQQETLKSIAQGNVPPGVTGPQAPGQPPTNAGPGQPPDTTKPNLNISEPTMGGVNGGG
jgi:hypothetical protein